MSQPDQQQNHHAHAQPNLPQNAQQHPQQQAQQDTIMVSRPLPPTLLRINADNQDKRAVIFFWLLFFIVIIVITIISSFLPIATFQIDNISQLRGTNIEGCTNPIQFDSNQILQCQLDNANPSDNLVGTVILDLQRENQFAVVFVKVFIKDNQLSAQQYSTKMISNFYTAAEEVNKDGKVQYKNIDQQIHQSNFRFYYKDSYKIYGDDGTTVLGYKSPIFVIRNFKQQSFVLINKFQRPIKQYPNVDRIQSSVLLVNPQFTKYSFAIRYVFFACSFIAFIIYLYRFCKIPVAERILEQRMIVFLSALLIFFNDPFYPITVLQPNRVSSYFSVFFIINFVIYLIFFWILFLDRMLYEDGQKQSKLVNWKRLLYIIITYIIVLVTYTLIAMDHIEGLPVVPTQDLFAQKIVLLEVAAILVVLLGFCYIVVSYIRLCMKADTLLWRNQLFLFFSVFFIVITISLFFINGFQINSFAGNRILLMFTVMNMYTFYMQYMYSISKQQNERVSRGQVQYHQQELLQIRSGQDYIDLQFDDGISIKNMEQQKQKYEQKLRNKTNEYQLKQKQKSKGKVKQGSNYGFNQDKKLQNVHYNTNQNENQDDKATDFFKEKQIDYEIKNIGKNGQKDDKLSKGNKNDQFEEFSLDD